MQPFENASWAPLPPNMDYTVAVPVSQACSAVLGM